MVSRADRDALARAMRRYLDEEITAFELDERLSDIGGKTQDETVELIAHALWFHYDDLEDHKVVASKQEWDYFQRLLLVLESDARIVVEKKRRWSLRQLVALVSLVGFCAAAVYLGWGQHLLIVALPFGLVSMLLSYWHDRSSPSPTQEELTAHPFSSVAEVVRARRRLPGFRKRKYPRHLANRTIRGRLGNAALQLQFRAMWALLSPLALLFQSLPVSEHEVRVVCPQAARANGRGLPASGRHDG